MENRTLGNIKILKKLGEGGMGAVWLGHHQTLDKKVAVKVLPQELARDETFAARFIREARAAARLEHPNVIQVLDADTHDGVRYIVMQYVEGTDLQKAIKRKGALPVRDSLSIVKRVAAALQAAHDLGLIHRDVKPSNIMVTGRGGVFIGDFGLARDTASGRTVTGAEQVVGTPHYMSPEQARGERLDARSDIYSLGATLYAMLTARPPFEAETPVGVMVKHAREDQHPEPVDKVNPAVPPAVAAVVARMMAKAPAARYGAMKDVIAAIKQAQDGAGDAPTVVAGSTVGPARKRPWLIPVAAGAAGMLIFLIVVGTLTGDGARGAFDEAALAESAAGGDPDKLQAAAKLYEAIALAFPRSGQAAEARRKAESVQKQADESRFAAALAKLDGMAFADALKSLQELTLLNPGAPGLNSRLEDLHRRRLVARSEEISSLMRERADEKMIAMMDPRDVNRLGKAGAFVFRKAMTSVLTGNEFIVAANPVERTIELDLAKETAKVDYQLTIETEPGKRKPGGLVLPWTLHQGEWYVSLAGLADRLPAGERRLFPFPRGKSAGQNE